MNRFINVSNSLESSFLKGKQLLSVKCDLLNLLPVLSAFSILLYFMNHRGEPETWYLHSLCAMMAVSLVIFPTLRFNFWIWLIIAICHAVILMKTWVLVNNHDFIMLYWDLVFLLASVEKGENDQKKRILRINARRLIGLIMLFSFIQKIISPAFMKGDVLYLSLLTDERFKDLAHLFSNVLDHELDANYLALKEIGLQFSEIFLWGKTNQLRLLSIVASYFILFLEGIMGIIFFLPNWHKVKEFRNIFMCLFNFVIYTFVPVFSFGLTLLILGLAQTDERDENDFEPWHCLYIGLIFYTLFSYSLPKNFSIFSM